MSGNIFNRRGIHVAVVIVLLKERYNPVVEQIRRRDRRLAIVQLGASNLRIGVDEGLPVDAADALEIADIERVLGTAIARMLALELIPCAVSASAMDEIEHVSRTAPDQREQQFLRLRDRIEQCASRKFLAHEFEGNPAGIILRSIDFRK